MFYASVRTAEYDPVPFRMSMSKFYDVFAMTDLFLGAVGEYGYECMVAEIAGHPVKFKVLTKDHLVPQGISCNAQKKVLSA